MILIFFIFETGRALRSNQRNGSTSHEEVHHTLQVRKFKPCCQMTLTRAFTLNSVFQPFLKSRNLWGIFHHFHLFNLLLFIQFSEVKWIIVGTNVKKHSNWDLLVRIFNDPMTSFRNTWTNLKCLSVIFFLF